MNETADKATSTTTKGNGAASSKRKGSLISILSIVFGILLGVLVAYLQFQIEYADDPSKFYDTQLKNYIWVNVGTVVVPWFLVFALGTPMATFAYIAFKRLLKI